MGRRMNSTSWDQLKIQHSLPGIDQSVLSKVDPGQGRCIPVQAHLRYHGEGAIK